MKRGVTAVHFVGIGGVGMSALAELLHRRGHPVSGSDLIDGAATKRLREMGVDVRIGHDADHLGKFDVLVRSSAIGDDNPEVMGARQLDRPIVSRGELLADIMNGHASIVVAGTHGKTTTASMIAHVLGEAGLDPTALVGGRLRGPQADGTGLRLGRDDLFVAESDESDGSFLHLRPTLAVVTNLDPEHLDHYGGYEALQEAFVEFTARLSVDGACVACADHPGVQAILDRIQRRKITYGFDSDADLRAQNARPDGHGMRFEVHEAGRELGPAFVPMPGLHNVSNALAALAVAREHGVGWSIAVDALAGFGGVDRRFQTIGEASGIRIVDDYAHHPAEIEATLSGARIVHPGRIVALFQPHRYTRTRDLFDGFVRCFDRADCVVVCSIYSAGDPEIAGVTGDSLAEAMADHGHPNVRHWPSLDDLVERLPAMLEPGDLVLTLGAGNISSVGPRLLAKLSELDGDGGRE